MYPLNFGFLQIYSPEMSHRLWSNNVITHSVTPSAMKALFSVSSPYAFSQMLPVSTCGGSCLTANVLFADRKFPVSGKNICFDKVTKEDVWVMREKTATCSARVAKSGFEFWREEFRHQSYYIVLVIIPSNCHLYGPGLSVRLCWDSKPWVYLTKQTEVGKWARWEPPGTHSS